MKDMEQVLLSNASLDELIKMKIEQEFENNLKNSKNNEPKQVTVTDLTKVPSDKIFSRDSVFRVYNRLNKTQSLINGVQADAMIGIQTGVREKFLAKTLTAFSTDDTYVKFEKAVITDV